MLFCNTCGECQFTGGNDFIEFHNVSGNQVRYLDSETGDITDYGDDNLESTGDDTYECPHCQSDDIEFKIKELGNCVGLVI